MDKQGITFKSGEATKYDTGWHGFSLEDTNSSENTITAIRITDNGTLTISGRSRNTIDFTTEVITLLQAQGIEARADSYGGGGNLQCVKADIPEHGIIKAVVALTSSVKGPRETHYAMLHKETALDILDMELRHLGKNPSDVGLLKFRTTTSHSGTPCLDSQIIMSGSSVSKICESVIPAGGQGMRPVEEMITYVKPLRDNHQIEQALKIAGETRKRGEEFEVLATADEVAQSLKEKRLLPASLADEIAQRALQLHPTQRQINNEVAASASSNMALIRRKNNSGTTSITVTNGLSAR
ncbi:MAG: hypothetical protein AB7F82_08230 [Alphaproteobacteria bacterium]